MNLTEEQVKEIIAKVNDDIPIYHNDKYPIGIRAFEKQDKDNDYKFASWSGGYEYNNPHAVGDKWEDAHYDEWIIAINDETGEAISMHYYTGHFEVKLNYNTGKYERGKQLYRH